MFGLFKKKATAITPETYGSYFNNLERWQQLEERQRWMSLEESAIISESLKYPSHWFEADGFTLKPFNGPSIKELASYKGSWRHDMDLQNIHEAKMLEDSMGGATSLRGGTRQPSAYL